MDHPYGDLTLDHILPWRQRKAATGLMDVIGEEGFVMSHSGRHLEIVSCLSGLRKKHGQ